MARLRYNSLGLRHLIDCCIYNDNDCVGLSSITQSQSGTSNPSPIKSTLLNILILPLRKSSIICLRSAFGVSPSKCTAPGICSHNFLLNDIDGQ